MQTAVVQPEEVLTGPVSSTLPPSEVGSIAGEELDDIVMRILQPESVEVAAFNSAM